MLWNYIQHYDTVIWDWNGTLLNDHEAAWKAECKLFEKIGKKHLDINERRNFFTMPVQEYYNKIGFDFSIMSYEEAGHQWFEHYENELKSVNLFEGTHELLQKIVDAGKKQFILSAAPESHLEAYTHENGLKKFFHGIYGLKTKAADCKRERGRDLFREHQLNPAKTLIIGDMVHDAEVAETLQCEVLLVADGHQSYEALLPAAKNVLQSRY